MYIFKMLSVDSAAHNGTGLARRRKWIRYANRKTISFADRVTLVNLIRKKDDDVSITRF